MRAGSLLVARNIYAENGLRGFYDGLSACLLRQSIYSGTRFGAYDVFKNALSGNDGGNAPLYIKLVAGKEFAFKIMK
jgi:solute carrier family 25 oxoglutarate transporter 11